MQKTILITGSTDGLGKAVATRLAKQGHKVLLHGRDPDKGEAVLADISAASGNTSLTYYNADLSSLKQVKAMASNILASQNRLDVLVNNAGIGPRTPDSPRSTSQDGYELFFAVNYLAGYLLVRELLPLLQQTTQARIINVASIAQAPVRFQDVMLEQEYDDGLAYRQSKLAQILHANHLAKSLAGTKVTANSLHPASLMNTKMVLESTALPDAMTTIDDGADALEFLISSPSLSGVSGAYFDGNNPATPNEQATDEAAMVQLKNISDSLISGLI
jgi:NAD(P)-dependent dehydrogenase (short-subunit alcohol dehydrogenase family)